ncbi:MAG: C39 family peptidase [Acidobacteria bacterium]|nr:C39 family peptidase [Acidobacteriota bacterium]
MLCRASASVAAAVLVMVASSSAGAQPSAPAGVTGLLDVPYIQQSEALCGGAAAAMVMRYWGETGVYAETFSSLVDRTAGGIRGDALLSALQARGWDARSFRGDAALVAARLADRQPVIALIEDRPGAFHYVVIVAWANGRVVVHDPARVPFRVLDDKAFDAAWQKSGHWTMLALPGEGLKRATVTPSSSATAGPSAASACSGLVDEGIRSAAEGAYPKALETLQFASELCPNASAPWREMAGVHALQADWGKAAAIARVAVSRDARDMHAWRILATSRFVTGDSAAALDAWNRIGELLIDLVTVHGLSRTRHAAATQLMGLEPQTLLTSQALAAANRRLDELPVAQMARVTYRPLESGRAAVDAVVVERPRAPTSLPSLAVVGVRTLSDRELRGWVANPTGAGDLITASWRWWENRPRIAFSSAAPAPGAGVMRIDVFRDVQTYEDTLNTERRATNVREVRRGGAVSVSNWTATSLRWQIGAGVDAWAERGKTLSINAGADQRLAGDRLSLHAGAGMFAGSFTSWTAAAGAQWRSSVRHEGHVLLTRAGVDVASARAPFALWPGAGLGHARGALLRAHPLLDDGVMTGDVFGRRVYHAGSEWRRWFKPGPRLVPIAPAVFVDVARAAKRLQTGAAWHADTGAGIRIAVPGSGVLRMDVAKGLRDGETVFSIGWMK